MPVKRVVGEMFRVEVSVFAPAGSVAVSLNWRRSGASDWVAAPMLPFSEKGERFAAELSFAEPGIYEYAVHVRFGNGAAFVENEPPEVLIVERGLARCAAWVRLDLRSLGSVVPQIDALAMMGFDLVLLPDIARADDGCALDPRFGTMDDFDRLVRCTRQRGLEIALSPKLRMANFYEGDWRGQLEQAWAMLRFWAMRGVRVFQFDAESVRVSPPGFWRELLSTARKDYPDLIFTFAPGAAAWEQQLALAKVGFGSLACPLDGSAGKAGLKKAIFDLSRQELCDFFRVSLWPDFSVDIYQRPSYATVEMNVALAVAISPAWGISSGIVLEEYSSLAGLVTKLNHIRNSHAGALSDPAQILICHCPSPEFLCLLRGDPKGEPVLFVIDLSGNGGGGKSAVIQFPRGGKREAFVLRDLLGGGVETWSGTQHSVKMESGVRIFGVER